MVIRTIALGVGLLSAVATSQAPEFLQQYRQRIGGALDGLRPIVTSLDQQAKSLGLKREEFVALLVKAPNPLWRQQSEVMAQAAHRYDRLLRTHEGWPQFGMFARLHSLVTDRDEELAQNTWNEFVPALPVSQEGALSAALGFVLGLLATLTLMHGGRGAMRQVGRLSSAVLARKRLAAGPAVGQRFDR